MNIPLVWLAIAIVIACSGTAEAATLSGPEVGWTRLADRVLLSADALGGIVPVIGLMLLGAAIIFSFQLPPIVDLLIAGAIVTLGSSVFNAVLGAEQPSMLLPGGLP